MMEETHDDVLRPEEMVPYVREYLGLMEDLRVLDAEVKRCLAEYRSRREKILTKRKPLADRFNRIEDVLKRTIHTQKLPGVKYKNFVFVLNKKTSYMRPEEKIAKALERNPVEHFANDRKGLARLIAQAVKKKCKQQPSDDFKDTVLQIREV